MPSSVPSFIRYFAQTEDHSEAGRVALAYLRSMLRIAPVRLVSLSGGLVGPWRAFEALLMTPMSGSYVNTVCAMPSRWIWEARVAMTESDAAQPFGVAAANDDPNAFQPPVAYAEGVEELYTDRVRNVLFIASPPITDEQHKNAMKYQARITPNLTICETIAARWPDLNFDAAVVPIPVENHARIREAICGAP